MRPLLALLLLAPCALLAQVPDYVPSDGLAGWWSLDGIALDASTNALHGTLEGPYATEDRHGNPNGALSFDGVDDRVSIPHSDFTNPSVLSLSVWFKDSDFSNSDGQQSQLISKREFTGWGNAYEVGIGYPINGIPDTPTIYSNFSVNGNHTVYHATDSLLENQWHHAVYCHGADSLFIYLDGEPVLAQTSLGPLPTNNALPTWFGGRPGGSGRHFFSGLLDDVGLWNRVLTAEEVAALFLAENSPALPDYVPTDGLVGWYPLDGNGLDLSVNLNHGTTIGTNPSVDRFGNNNAALFFDGIDDEVVITDFGLPESPPALTQSTWFKVNTSSSNTTKQVLLTRREFEPYSWITLNIVSGVLSVTNDHPSCLNDYPISDLSDPLDTNWHHLVSVLVMDSLSVYYDGVLNSTWNLADGCGSVSSNGAMSLGNHPEWTNNISNSRLHGVMDDIGFWNRPLNAIEINGLFNASSPIPGCTDTAACNFSPAANLLDASCLYGCVCDEDLTSAIESSTINLCAGDSVFLRPLSQRESTPIVELPWKASCTAPTNWTSQSFNDDSWTPAAIADYCSNGDVNTAINNCGNADYAIWAEGACEEAFLRWTFLATPSDTFWLDMAVDNEFECYLDGELILSGNNWPDCQTTMFTNLGSSVHHVLAIHAIDWGGCDGVWGVLDHPAYSDTLTWSNGIEAPYQWVTNTGTYCWSHPEGMFGSYTVSVGLEEGCMDENACNFNPEAFCSSDCIYPPLGLNDCNIGANLCGDGTSWNPQTQLCISDADTVLIPSEDCAPFCGEGTVWDPINEMCIVAIPADINFDGCVTVGDLLELLAVHGTCPPYPEWPDLPNDTSNTEWSCGDPLAYQGYDYATVQIGDQCWFAENCRFLPSVSAPSNMGTFELDMVPRAFVYGNFSTSISEAATTAAYATYGAIYNWAATENWEICPNGWHIPADVEWQTLESNMGMSPSEVNDIGWQRGHEDALSIELQTNGFQINSTGGFVHHTLGFLDENDQAFYWSSTLDVSNPSIPGPIFHRRFSGSQDGIYRNSDFNQNSGAYVRCLKD